MTSRLRRHYTWLMWNLRNVLLWLFAAVILSACQTPATSTLSPSPTRVEPAAAPTVAPTGVSTSAPSALRVQEYPVPSGSHPHDVAPAPDGSIWYTAQTASALGNLDPSTGKVKTVNLGDGSAPHGVIIGPDGAPWITDAGLNAIVRVDPETLAVQRFPLPSENSGASLNTATFDRNGTLWFTGQTGIYGRLNPADGKVQVYKAPKGQGPYGITSTPDGNVFFASLASSYVGRIEVATGSATVLLPPTADQGARRVWSDSKGRVWVSEWNAGKVAVFDPATNQWQEWPLPGTRPMPYAVYVDARDQVWLSDFGANALVRFDPARGTFDSIALPSPSAFVRQLNGRPGEVWGAESGVDKLVVVRGE